MKLYLLIMSVGFLLQCAMAPRSSEAASGTAEVELDIFSGRPNPAWTLSGEETRELLGMLENLPSTNTRSPEAGLGYRGFVVSFQDQRRRVTTVRIHGGTVERSVGESSEFFADKDRKLERWLLDTGQSKLDPSVFTAVSEKLG